MRPVGLHMRIAHTILEVMRRAEVLQLPLLQCFFFLQQERSPLVVTSQEIKEFQQRARDRFQALYLHGSYGINLADVNKKSHRLLERELNLAKRLEFTHFVLHPGAVKGTSCKTKGIDALASHLNNWLKKENSITFVLENMAYDKMTIGGDLYDFKQVREKLDQPERVKFCVDTAHAYAFGYDIGTLKGLQQFIGVVDNTIGTENIALIHLNDTTEALGSKRDRHSIPGQGEIGLTALKKFVLHKQLRAIPIVMELPHMDVMQESIILDSVKKWHSGV